MKDPSELTNNCLKTLFPEIASQWNYEKNGDLTPLNVSKGSRQKVWWICKNGHEYQAKVYHRTHAGSGCPYCINHKTIPGINDLPTRFPEIFAEWDYNKNSGTNPTHLRTKAPERFWWICPKGHHYQAKVFDRIYSKSGCILSYRIYVISLAPKLSAPILILQLAELLIQHCAALSFQISHET